MKLTHYFSALTFSAASLVCLASGADSSATLKGSADGLFFVGAALNTGEIRESDKKGSALVAQHFNSITPENILKWQHVHPKPGKFEFDLPDKYVALGQKHGMFIVGHTLLWHQQTPAWVFKNESGGEVSREELLKRLREHIQTVVGRYRGKINGWDVVNEAIDDATAELRTDRPWYRILGKEAIFAAFAAAHEADPDAELYYNDYSMDNPRKRAAVIKLVNEIKARGLRIDGVGTQEHHLLRTPTLEAVNATFEDLRKTGLQVHVTELDVSVLPRPEQEAGANLNTRFENSAEFDPYRKGMPAGVAQELGTRYRDLFAIYAKHQDIIKRVTFWGVTDKSSWLNGWPIRGRRDHPLLFDRDYKAKPAFNEVLEVLNQARTSAK